jgi:hypothetical protein
MSEELLHVIWPGNPFLAALHERMAGSLAGQDAF